MRKKLYGILAATILGFSFGIPAASAREAGRGVALGSDIPGPNVEVCTYNSSGHPTQCINDWNGNLTNNAHAARFYEYINNPDSIGNNLMYFEYVGTINTSGSFQPFSDGSGLNTRYNGDEVFALQWLRESSGYNYDTGVCIGGDAPYALPYNENCNSGSRTLYYAWSAYDDLISVGASNYRNWSDS